MSPISQIILSVSNMVGSYFESKSLFLNLKRMEVFPVAPSPMMQSFLFTGGALSAIIINRERRRFGTDDIIKTEE